MAIAQSSSHNYIKETVYLDSMGTGITNVRYYNGLGYLTETASTCSGTSDNVYTYTTYDSKGRESTLYCPTPAGNTLDFQRLSAIRSASASFYRDNGAYTQNHYDHADRITREDIAGERWHSDNAHNSTEYGTNTQDDKVIIYNGTVNAEGFYPAGNLEKKTVTDADGHSVTVFTNLFGQTVLERRFCGDTYYIQQSGTACRHSAATVPEKPRHGTRLPVRVRQARTTHEEDRARGGVHPILVRQGRMAHVRAGCTAAHKGTVSILHIRQVRTDCRVRHSRRIRCGNVQPS